MAPLPGAPIDPLEARAAAFHFTGSEPDALGPVEGHLRPCAGSSHCAQRSWTVKDPQIVLQQLTAAAAGLPGTDSCVARTATSSVQLCGLWMISNSSHSLKE